VKTMTCEYIVTVTPVAASPRAVFRFPVRIPVTGDVVVDHDFAAALGQACLPWNMVDSLPVTLTNRVAFSTQWV
jgi:hypothetical protein